MKSTSSIFKAIQAQLSKEPEIGINDSILPYLEETFQEGNKEKHSPIPAALIDAILTEWLESEEQKLKEQLSYYCYLMYFVMESTHEWGDAGYEQVYASFCRNQLQIPAQDTLTQAHADAFVQYKEDAYEAHGILDLSLEQAKAKLKAYAFTFFENSYSLQDFQKLARHLRYLGSDLYLQGGFYGTDVEFILGTGSHKEYDDYTVIQLNHELLRTPNTIVAMAAIIGDKEIVQRRESLATIYQYKWDYFYRHHLDAHTGLLAEENIFSPTEHQISDKIKQKTIACYEASLDRSFSESRFVFIDDMEETILFHEIGHGIAQYHAFSKQAGALAEATKVIGENILTACLEFLADFAPTHGNSRGPFQNMINISKTDPKRAERMFYMYMSDTWFFDTNDTYMYLYSEMLAATMGACVMGTIDFDKLQQFVGHGIADKHSLVGWVLEQVTQSSTEIIDILKTYTYDLSGLNIDLDQFPEKYHANVTEWIQAQNSLATTTFEGLSELATLHVSKDITSPTEKETYTYETSYWSAIMEYALFDPNFEGTLTPFLDKKENTMMTHWFEKLFGPDVGSSRRDYIFNLFQEIF